jgi:hypothetical protein
LIIKFGGMMGFMNKAAASHHRGTFKECTPLLFEGSRDVQLS